MEKNDADIETECKGHIIPESKNMPRCTDLVLRYQPKEPHDHPNVLENTQALCAINLSCTEKKPSLLLCTRCGL